MRRRLRVQAALLSAFFGAKFEKQARFCARDYYCLHVGAQRKEPLRRYYTKKYVNLFTRTRVKVTLSRFFFYKNEPNIVQKQKYVNFLKKKNLHA